MTRNEFIELIKDEITVSGALPYTPPDKEIIRVINKEMKYLYREYRNILHDRIYIINKSYFQTQEFRDSRTIQLHDCTEGIKSVVEMSNGSRVFGINDPDLSFDRLMASDLYLTPLSSDQITYRTIQWSFWDLARSFNLKEINHNFNQNTHRLIITGRTPDQSLFILAMDHLAEEDAYEDIIVQEWIIAKVKLSLVRMLGMFSYNLIGGVTINHDMWKTEATESLNDLKEKIKGDDVPDWFDMIH